MKKKKNYRAKPKSPIFNAGVTSLVDTSKFWQALAETIMKTAHNKCLIYYYEQVYRRF